MTESTEQQEPSLPSVGPLDPDFILALFVGIMLDLLEFFGIGVLLSLLAGWGLSLWIIKKEDSIDSAKQRAQEIRTAHKERRKGQNLKGGARSTKTRSFGKGKLKRFLKRYLLGSFLFFFPYWTWALIQLLRKR